MFRRSDFKKLELLGSGKKNTKIFKVEHLPTKKIYALKEVEAKSLDKLNEYKEEAVQLCKAQNHPNILQFYGYYFYETQHATFKLGIVCEYISESQNLEVIYRKRENKSKNLIWKFFFFLNSILLERGRISQNDLLYGRRISISSKHWSLS